VRGQAKKYTIDNRKLGAYYWGVQQRELTMQDVNAPSQESIVGIMAAIIHAGSEQTAYKEGMGAVEESSAAAAWRLWNMVNRGDVACQAAAKEYWRVYGGGES
jgi:hypothetical protein